MAPWISDPDCRRTCPVTDWLRLQPDRCPKSELVNYTTGILFMVSTWRVPPDAPTIPQQLVVAS